MKESELRKCARCAHCGKLIGQNQLPIFYRVTIERHGVDVAAVNRKSGLEAFLNSPRLASVMGPDEDMTMPLMIPRTITICERCSLEDTPVALLAELGNQAAAEEEIKSDGRQLRQ
jgi:hypothetical protein